MFFSLIGQAQVHNEIDNKMSVKKMKSRAENASKAGDIYTALFYYQEIIKVHPKDNDARYQLAEMHRLSRNYKAAEEAYSYVIDSVTAPFPFALFYKARM